MVIDALQRALLIKMCENLIGMDSMIDVHEEVKKTAATITELKDILLPGGGGTPTFPNLGTPAAKQQVPDLALATENKLLKEQNETLRAQLVEANEKIKKICLKISESRESYNETFAEINKKANELAQSVYDIMAE